MHFCNRLIFWNIFILVCVCIVNFAVVTLRQITHQGGVQGWWKPCLMIIYRFHISYSHNDVTFGSFPVFYEIVVIECSSQRRDQRPYEYIPPGKGWPTNALLDVPLFNVLCDICHRMPFSLVRVTRLRFTHTFTIAVNWQYNCDFQSKPWNPSYPLFNNCNSSSFVRNCTIVEVLDQLYHTDRWSINIIYIGISLYLNHYPLGPSHHIFEI